MKTTHKLIFENAAKLNNIESESIDLVITSPPYPMVEMWDEIFSEQRSGIKQAFLNKDGRKAFELMHSVLDNVWSEVYRVLKNGGFLCINIGDAARTLDGIFQIYLNHSRISEFCTSLGFNALPAIIWRKQTNAPNKFMGSGMLPTGAYVTLEHEYILIFRKGSKREFKNSESKLKRQQSAYFWEERNVWFSDLWDFKGTSQKLSAKNTRNRSAAYPFELAYRLINMYSVMDDTVLDPFAGTGTTMLAAIASKRNSIGIEIDKTFKNVIEQNIMDSTDTLNSYVDTRFNRHLKFVNGKSNLKHRNSFYNFPVMTSQEVNIILPRVIEINETKDLSFEAQYENYYPYNLFTVSNKNERGLKY